jgi:hypothetical protein
MSDIPFSGETAADEGSAAQAATEALETVSRGVKTAIQKGREPDMPLGFIASLTREAPLAALTIAFLLGWLVARR